MAFVHLASLSRKLGTEPCLLFGKAEGRLEPVFQLKVLLEYLFPFIIFHNDTLQHLILLQKRLAGIKNYVLPGVDLRANFSVL